MKKYGVREQLLSIGLFLDDSALLELVVAVIVMSHASADRALRILSRSKHLDVACYSSTMCELEHALNRLG
ncbi:hypothetical protein JH26_02210 [Microvirga sp. BSC39]|nr:hypothetical protein JH26_02210 [Microvirga sp. BSC39]